MSTPTNPNSPWRKFRKGGFGPTKSARKNANRRAARARNARSFNLNLPPL